MKFAILAALALPLGLAADQCYPVPYCARIGSNSVFFVGELIESRQAGTGTIYEERFRVLEAFRGVREGDLVAVLTHGFGKLGTDAFVQAWRNLDGAIRVGSCPEMMSGDESMLDFLRRCKRGEGPGASLTVISQDGRYQSVGATVSIDGPVKRTGTELPRGGFRFDEIPVGHYYIRASRSGFVMQRPSERVEVVPNACPIGLVDMVAIRRISGRVTTAEGTPAPRARVTVKSRHGEQKNRAAVADDAGRYEISNLPPGDYTVMAQPVGLDFPVFYPARATAEEAGTVRLKPQDDREINLTLFPMHRKDVRFRFFDSAGRILPNLLLTFWRGSDRETLDWRRILTDNTGSCTVTLVLNAGHRLTWVAEYYQSAPGEPLQSFAATIELKPRETTEEVSVVFPR